MGCGGSTAQQPDNTVPPSISGSPSAPKKKIMGASRSASDGTKTSTESFRLFPSKDKLMQRIEKKKNLSPKEQRVMNANAEPLSQEDIKYLRANPALWTMEAVYTGNMTEFWDTYFGPDVEDIGLEELHSLAVHCVQHYCEVLVDFYQNKGKTRESRGKSADVLVAHYLPSHLPGKNEGAAAKWASLYFLDKMDKEKNGCVTKLAFIYSWPGCHISMFSFAEVDEKKSKFVKRIKKLDPKALLKRAKKYRKSRKRKKRIHGRQLSDPGKKKEQSTNSLPISELKPLRPLNIRKLVPSESTPAARKTATTTAGKPVLAGNTGLSLQPFCPVLPPSLQRGAKSSSKTLRESRSSPPMAINRVSSSATTAPDMNGRPTFIPGVSTPRVSRASSSHLASFQANVVVDQQLTPNKSNHTKKLQSMSESNAVLADLDHWLDELDSD